MKKSIFIIFISTLFLSACSIGWWKNKNDNYEFNINQSSENFELDGDDINTNKIPNNEILIPKDELPKTE